MELQVFPRKETRRHRDSASHVRSVWCEIFGLPAPERLALRFLIKTLDAERFRWETIHSGPPDTRFLAISDLCTVTRLAPTKIESALRGFTYPLRMIAFLSAAGIKAEAEMQKICERICRASICDRPRDRRCIWPRRHRLGRVRVGAGAASHVGVDADSFPGCQRRGRIR